MINQIHHIDAFELLAYLPNESVDLILTDPPYGTTYNSWDADIDLNIFFSEAFRVLTKRGLAIIFGNQPFTSKVVCAMGKRYRAEYVWAKNPIGHLTSGYRPMRNHENIIVGALLPMSPTGNQQAYYAPYTSITVKTEMKPKKVSSKSWLDPTVTNWKIKTKWTRRQNMPNTIMRFPNDKGFHPTQKPVELLKHLIRLHCPEDGIVLDPFSGSGSTAVAAIQTGRRYIASELDPVYLAKSRARLSAVQMDLLVAT